MFSRLRASVVGGEGAPPQSTPPLSPRRQLALSPSGQQQPQSPHSQPQRGGLLSPLFFSNSSSSSNINNSSNATSSPHPPSLPLTHHESLNQSQSFFGGLFTSSQSATSLPVPSRSSTTTEASPRSIRASASALLKMATPPPFTSSSSSSFSGPNNNSNTLTSTKSNHRNNNSSSQNNDENDDDDRDALEYQLQHRENYISKLTSDLHKLQDYTVQYQRDIQTLRRQQLESSFRHRVSAKLWRRTNEGLAARIACYQKELTSEAAREIANLIRDAAPPNKDSTYLMMLQDQLNKATLKLSHLSSQTEVILSKGEEVIESLRTEMNEVIRERCKMELELLDSINGLEEDMKRMVNRTERRLKRVQGEIDYLEKNAVEVLKSKEAEEEEKEEDKEEDENLSEEGDDDVVESQDQGEADIEEGDGGKQSKNKEKEVDTKEAEDGNPSNEVPDNDRVAMKDSQQNPRKEKEGEEYERQQRPQQQHTPENLRIELRKLATDRDATLSILQKKLREKNEEFQTLLKSKKSREATIEKLESVKRDREEWERSREEGFSPTMI